MALSYPGRFERLFVQSASWATCSGAVCVLPESLPHDHPPTLFLHGEDDDIVPVGTMPDPPIPAAMSRAAPAGCTNLLRRFPPNP